MCDPRDRVTQRYTPGWTCWGPAGSTPITSHSQTAVSAWSLGSFSLARPSLPFPKLEMSCWKTSSDRSKRECPESHFEVSVSVLAVSWSSSWSRHEYLSVLGRTFWWCPNPEVTSTKDHCEMTWLIFSALRVPISEEKQSNWYWIRIENKPFCLWI